MTDKRQLDELLQTAIETFIDSPANSLRQDNGDPAFALPLVGYARGDDPIFTDFKEHVGPFHWTPVEAFHLGCPAETAQPSELTVLSWVLPQTAKTKRQNRRQKRYPSESWARARIFGEDVNEALRRRVVATLHGKSIPAVAPALLPQWSRRDSQRFVWASTWSERHMAYAAGLGTFGVCDGLITPRGKAMRVGSVVAKTRELPISGRPYDDHRAYCLFHRTGSCLVCARRCPVDAISAAGHDKRICRSHVHETCKNHVRGAYGLEGYACGLCQTGVPCESGIPGETSPRR